ncbi:Lrp/AsnC family transcriptional regulator [Parvularcula maris]|uniref:Lrp/AsnC family transcriptional regulator n=1 Tax=Parvularcula maris TaxID=2965077 RepID=A0A9X2LBF1_9PROT|nr:Lrp/AsnC family transcriptional regulator [Parvularcula maris]MCQ8186590.1 Lrp/AsnC family transcriptional regulator [Parvularcula maris]
MSDQTAELDRFDRAILRILQRDNQRSHEAIGRAVGLSGSAVRRRIVRLREEGVIARDVSLLDPVGWGVRLIVTLTFGEETVEAYEALDEQMAAEPHVMQSYHVAGTEDYVLIVHGPNLPWYEAWSKDTFMTNPAIRRYETKVVWSCKKFETSVPL